MRIWPQRTSIFPMHAPWGQLKGPVIEAALHETAVCPLKRHVVLDTKRGQLDQRARTRYRESARRRQMARANPSSCISRTLVVLPLPLAGAPARIELQP